MPSCSVISMCCRRTLSWIVTLGKRPRSTGAGLLLGDDDRPLARRSVRMMKYLFGSMARPSPSMKISLSSCVPVYQLGTSTALSRAPFSVPRVA